MSTIATLRKSSPDPCVTSPSWRVSEDRVFSPDAPIILKLRGYAATALIGIGIPGEVTVWLPREVAAELGVLPRAADTRIERALEIFDELSGGAYFTTSDIIKVVDILRGAP